MTSGETLPRGEAASGTTTGIVLVAHGGQDSSTEPTSALQPAVLRMIPVGAAIRYGLRGSVSPLVICSPRGRPGQASRQRSTLVRWRRRPRTGTWYCAAAG